jgi:hypothetical protein
MPNHARAFDLPGWPCPPRVRDIVSHENSWGYVMVSRYVDPFAVAVDELGYLWANGDIAPQFRVPDDASDHPGALLCWVPNGLGLWVHPKSLGDLPSISRLDMKPDQWIPVAVALAEMPAAAKAHVEGPAKGKSPEDGRG